MTTIQYQKSKPKIIFNSNYQISPDTQRNQSILEPPSNLIQELENLNKKFKLIDELKQCNRNITNPEIESVIREIKSQKLKLEKINSTNKKLVRNAILSSGIIVINKREENLKIEKVVKEPQDNIQDSPSPFSSQFDKKFLKKQEEKTEKIIKSVNDYSNTNLELIENEWADKYGKPIVEGFILGGLNLLHLFMELHTSKFKKQEKNPPPKRVKLVPSNILL